MSEHEDDVPSAVVRITDVVVLGPASGLAFQTRPSDIRTVLVDGRVVKLDGELVGLDLAGLLAGADASAAAVVAGALQLVSSLPPPNPGGLDQIVALAVGNLAS